MIGVMSIVVSCKRRNVSPLGLVTLRDLGPRDPCDDGAM